MSTVVNNICAADIWEIDIDIDAEMYRKTETDNDIDIDARTDISSGPELQ